MMSTSDRILETIAAIYDTALDHGRWDAALERFGHTQGVGAPPIDMFQIEARPRGMPGAIQGLANAGFDGRLVVSAIYSQCNGTSGRPPVDLMATLLPHLARAMRLQMQLRVAEARADSAIDSLQRLAQAVLFVDAAARVVFANRAAEAVLAAADGLAADARGLRASRPAGTAALRRLIAGAAAPDAAAPDAGAVGGSLLLDRPSGRRALSALVLPLRRGALPGWVPGVRPRVMIVVTDPDASHPAPDAQRLRTLFGLTPAEAAVAAQVARGGGIKMAARTLGIAPSTVRTHLHRAFAKTGTARQAGLAALLASLPADAPGPQRTGR